MNECIERDVQPMRYQNAFGNPIEGYAPTQRVVSAQVVSNDVCCAKGCDGIEFGGLLAACSDRTEEEAGVTFTPTLAIDVKPDICSAVVDINVSYFLSTGDVACIVGNQVNYSTEFGDSFVVMQNCCSGAVQQVQATSFAESDLSKFCYEEETITDGSEVDFNDLADDGTGVCTMMEGTTQTSYQDADFVTQYVVENPTDLSGTIVDNKICCLAYDEEGEINNSYELTFACEEITVQETTASYDPISMTCTVEDESYVYVDLDANEQYDPEIDGERFDYQSTSEVDETGDQCCMKAAEEGDLETAEAACDRCEYDNAINEFYYYYAPICIRRFDVLINCYVSSGLGISDAVYTNEQKCVEEELSASDCCAAKQAGKDGIGLEDACTVVVYPDIPEGDENGD